METYMLTDQASDVLTKAFTFTQFHYLRSKLNVHPRISNSRGDVSETDNLQRTEEKLSLRGDVSEAAKYEEQRN